MGGMNGLEEMRNDAKMEGRIVLCVCDFRVSSSLYLPALITVRVLGDTRTPNRKDERIDDTMFQSRLKNERFRLYQGAK